MARYCRDRKGEVIPWEIIKAKIETTHDFAVFDLRRLLSVPYFEKAIYELADADVTPARLLALADEIETKIEGGPAPRPLFSVRVHVKRWRQRARAPRHPNLRAPRPPLRG